MLITSDHSVQRAPIL